ncbi:hypothetical protein A4X13_0g4941 [Tilletia indica]|uniref:Uncharacterized protein n=1 Tax=Tilletia indica TaxID=43049 RepID=A0A177T5M9_9BASI|nr:hypothetical protein A4X13_0g4941 [Tilletia indica]
MFNSILITRTNSAGTSSASNEVTITQPTNCVLSASLPVSQQTYISSTSMSSPIYDSKGSPSASQSAVAMDGRNCKSPRTVNVDTTTPTSSSDSPSSATGIIDVSTLPAHILQSPVSSTVLRLTSPFRPIKRKRTGKDIGPDRRKDWSNIGIIMPAASGDEVVEEELQHGIMGLRLHHDDPNPDHDSTDIKS